MICKRCGHCCKWFLVVVVKDPERIAGSSIDENDAENFMVHEGRGIPCPHLRGDKPGEYSCAIHDKEWFKDTPCAAFCQIERLEEEECRIGKYNMQKLGVIIDATSPNDIDDD